MIATTAATLSSKGQITIPREVRDALQLHQGDGVLFSIEGEQVVFRKADQETLTSLFGRQKPWRESGTGFQKGMRHEWTHRHRGH